MSTEPAPKRRRTQRSPSPPVYKLDDEDNNVELYVPVAQRRQAKLAKLTSWGNSREQTARQKQQEEEEREDEEREEERKKEKARKERTLLMEAQEVHSKKAEEGVYKSHNGPRLLLKFSTRQILRRPIRRR